MYSAAVKELQARKKAVLAQIRGLNTEIRKIDQAINVATKLDTDLAALKLGEPTEQKPAKKKRKMSAAGKARLRAFQIARWAKINAAKAKAAAPAVVAPPAGKPGVKKQKSMSPLGKLRIKLGALNRYGKTAEAKQVAAQIAALEAKK